MPGRAPRDYRAEERRRNELAQQRGYATRASERAAKTRPPWQRAGFTNDYQYRKARRDARAWTSAHSRQDVSAYRKSFSPEEFREYYDAMVNGWGARRDSAEYARRKQALRRWIVDETHHMTDEEYDDDPRY